MKFLGKPNPNGCRWCDKFLLRPFIVSNRVGDRGLQVVSVRMFFASESELFAFYIGVISGFLPTWI